MSIYPELYNYHLKTGDLKKLYKYDRIIYKNQIGGSNKKELINKIIKFIKKAFNSFSFERKIALDKYNGFASGFISGEYEKFIKHNEKCVKKLSMDDLKFISRMIDKIKKKN